MVSSAGQPLNRRRRRSILDLAPFELDCLNAIWPLGEASVRQVQEALASRRPRAYTTIMTILDRLAQKGIVTRRKAGRAYLYRASLMPSEARENAVEQVVAGFFGGSRGALAAHLAGERPSDAKVIVRPSGSANRRTALAGREDGPTVETPDRTDGVDRTLL